MAVSEQALHSVTRVWAACNEPGDPLPKYQSRSWVSNSCSLCHTPLSYLCLQADFRFPILAIIFALIAAPFVAPWYTTHITARKLTSPGMTHHTQGLERHVTLQPQSTSDMDIYQWQLDAEPNAYNRQRIRSVTTIVLPVHSESKALQSAMS